MKIYLYVKKKKTALTAGSIQQVIRARMTLVLVMMELYWRVVVMYRNLSKVNIPVLVMEIRTIQSQTPI